jgi:hypothetical protein
VVFTYEVEFFEPLLLRLVHVDEHEDVREDVETAGMCKCVYGKG